MFAVPFGVARFQQLINFLLVDAANSCAARRYIIDQTVIWGEDKTRRFAVTQ
jgi:hypothetical protein